MLRHLVRRHGFRELVLHDDRSVVADLNRWVHGADDDVAPRMSPGHRGRTPRPSRSSPGFATTTPTTPDDPISLYGLTEPAALADDYDRALDAITTIDPALAADIREHYTVTAHQFGEHVQLAGGIHPGRPFAEHARQARKMNRRCRNRSSRSPT